MSLLQKLLPVGFLTIFSFTVITKNSNHALQGFELELSIDRRGSATKSPLLFIVVVSKNKP